MIDFFYVSFQIKIKLHVESKKRGNPLKSALHFPHITLFVLDWLQSQVKADMHACMHAYRFTYSRCTEHTYKRMPGMFCGCVSLCAGEWVSGLCARAAWVFMGASTTSGSGNVDIWFPDQSEHYLVVWVWSDKGGGLQYILTSIWGKETEQATGAKLRRASNFYVCSKTPTTSHHEDSDSPLHLCSSLSVLVHGR